MTIARRVGLLVVGFALLEIVAVSQISILTVSADLSPLVVMAVGLLAGSVVGAAAGFGMGLFLDLALVQTLGVSSLVLLVVGYVAGRLREGPNPHGAIVPVAAGAGATAIATVGYAIIQFLLGVDSP